MSDSRELTTEEQQELDTLINKLDRKLPEIGMPRYMIQRSTLSVAVSFGRRAVTINNALLYIGPLTAGLDEQSAILAVPFEAQAMLAAENPVRFAKGLHAFFKKNGGVITKASALHAYLTLLAYFEDRCGLPDDDPQIQSAVIYTDLMRRQLDYLLPNTFDFNALIAGMHTDGTPLLVRNPFPNLDAANFEVGRLNRGLSDKDFSALIVRTYAKYGYSDADTPVKARILHADSQIHIRNLTALAPFIGDHEIAFLPERPLSSQISDYEWPEAVCDIPEMKELLRCTVDSLPEGGLCTTFDGTAFYHSLIVKRIHNACENLLLFRLNTGRGDLSGYISLDSEKCITPFKHIKGTRSAENLHSWVQAIALWSCAAYLNLGNFHATTESYQSSFMDFPNVTVAVTER